MVCKVPSWGAPRIRRLYTPRGKARGGGGGLDSAGRVRQHIACARAAGGGEVNEGFSCRRGAYVLYGNQLRFLYDGARGSLSSDRGSCTATLEAISNLLTIPNPAALSGSRGELLPSCLGFLTVDLASGPLICAYNHWPRIQPLSASWASCIRSRLVGAWISETYSRDSNRVPIPYGYWFLRPS